MARKNLTWARRSMDVSPDKDGRARGTERTRTSAVMATGTRARSPRSQREVLRLYARPPFRLDLTAWALRRREQNAIDHWDGRTYRRGLVIKGHQLAVAVTQAGTRDTPRLDVVLSGRALPPHVQKAAGETLTRMLGLEIDLSSFYARAAGDVVLAQLVARYRGLKPPRFPSLFEALLNAVACQQLSLAAGLTMLSRLAEACGPPVEALHSFPDPEDVLRMPALGLRQLGFSKRKAHTILELASAAADGELDLVRFEPRDDDEVVQTLVQYPGIGRWSADYALLRGLGRLHVFPSTDVGAINGLRRFLAASGLDDDPADALAHWRRDAGLLYFHLLLRGLEERGSIDPRGR